MHPPYVTSLNATPEKLAKGISWLYSPNNLLRNALSTNGACPETLATDYRDVGCSQEASLKSCANSICKLSGDKAKLSTGSVRADSDTSERTSGANSSTVIASNVVNLPALAKAVCTQGARYQWPLFLKFTFMYLYDYHTRRRE